MHHNAEIEKAQNEYYAQKRKMQKGDYIETCKDMSITYRFIYWITKNHNTAYSISDINLEINRYKGLFGFYLNKNEGVDCSFIVYLNKPRIRIYENINQYSIKAIDYCGELH